MIHVYDVKKTHFGVGINKKKMKNSGFEVMYIIHKTV